MMMAFLMHGCSGTLSLYFRIVRGAPLEPSLIPANKQGPTVLTLHTAVQDRVYGWLSSDCIVATEHQSANAKRKRIQTMKHALRATFIVMFGCLLTCASLMAGAQDSSTTAPAPDNTKVNQRDTNKSAANRGSAKSEQG